MKKISTLLLALLLIVTTLTGCIKLKPDSGDGITPETPPADTKQITKLEFNSNKDVIISVDSTLKEKDWLNVTAKSYDESDITFESSVADIVTITKSTKASSFIWYDMTPAKPGKTIISAKSGDITSTNSINAFVYKIHKEEDSSVSSQSIYVFRVVTGSEWTETELKALFTKLNKSFFDRCIMLCFSTASEADGAYTAGMIERVGDTITYNAPLIDNPTPPVDPPTTSIVLAPPTNMTLEVNKLVWSKISNAKEYSVKIVSPSDKTTSYLVKTNEFSLLNNIVDNGVYKISICAVGDNITYLSSRYTEVVSVKRFTEETSLLDVVYWGNTGTKYHIKSTCPSLDNPNSGTLEQAKTVRQGGWCGLCSKDTTDESYFASLKTILIKFETIPSL